MTHPGDLPGAATGFAEMQPFEPYTQIPSEFAACPFIYQMRPLDDGIVCKAGLAFQPHELFAMSSQCFKFGLILSISATKSQSWNQSKFSAACCASYLNTPEKVSLNSCWPFQKIFKMRSPLDNLLDFFFVEVASCFQVLQFWDHVLHVISAVQLTL